MNKKEKNESSSSSVSEKATSKKKMTKKDLEIFIKSLQDKHLRLKAEFDNFRKRKESEISALFKYDGKNFIIDFLSILDNINRGISSYKDENTKKALELIRQDFLKKMNDKEIKEFGKVGDIFHPELHEALTTASFEDKKDNEIVEVYELGFKYKDLIIRHAKVVVNKK